LIVWLSYEVGFIFFLFVSSELYFAFGRLIVLCNFVTAWIVGVGCLVLFCFEGKKKKKQKMKKKSRKKTEKNEKDKRKEKKDKKIKNTKKNKKLVDLP